MFAGASGENKAFIVKLLQQQSQFVVAVGERADDALMLERSDYSTVDPKEEVRSRPL